jgi:hypothetical protein
MELHLETPQQFISIFHIIIKFSNSQAASDYISLLRTTITQAYTERFHIDRWQLLHHTNDNMTILEENFYFPSKRFQDAFCESVAYSELLSQMLNFTEQGTATFETSSKAIICDISNQSSSHSSVNREGDSESHQNITSSRTKSKWPELKNKEIEEGIAIIKRERPDLKVSQVPQGAMVTMDMRMDRVRVYHKGQ